MLKRVAIITDSTADIPDIAPEYGIYVVPLYVRFGEETLKDGIDLDAEAFYRRLELDPHHPQTAQPTPTDFIEAYRQAQQEADAEELFVVTISSDLSGTYASAVAAQRAVEFPVHVLDSRMASIGLGVLAVAAAEAADKGMTGAGVMEAVSTLAQRTRLFFVVDTLEYLHRGGRIGTASKFIGTALSIKPILEVSEGIVQARERVRTKRRALDRLLDLLEAHTVPDKPIRALVGHGGAREEAEDLAQRCKARFPNISVMVTSAGPTIGTHTGPRLVGISFYQEGV